MRTTEDMISSESLRYEFGKNWTRFVRRSVDPERVAIAKEHLLDFCKRESLDGTRGGLRPVAIESSAC